MTRPLRDEIFRCVCAVAAAHCDDAFGHEEMSIEESCQAILKAVEARLPKEKDGKYFEAFGLGHKDGYNQAIADMRKAINDGTIADC